MGLVFHLFGINAQFQIAVFMNWSPVFTCDMTMVPYTNIFFTLFFITNVALLCLFEILFIITWVILKG